MFLARRLCRERFFHPRSSTTHWGPIGSSPWLYARTLRAPERAARVGAEGPVTSAPSSAKPRTRGSLVPPPSLGGCDFVGCSLLRVGSVFYLDQGFPTEMLNLLPARLMLWCRSHVRSEHLEGPSFVYKRVARLNPQTLFITFDVVVRTHLLDPGFKGGLPGLPVLGGCVPIAMLRHAELEWSGRAILRRRLPEHACPPSGVH